MCGLGAACLFATAAPVIGAAVVGVQYGIGVGGVAGIAYGTYRTVNAPEGENTTLVALEAGVEPALVAGAAMGMVFVGMAAVANAGPLNPVFEGARKEKAKGIEKNEKAEEEVSAEKEKPVQREKTSGSVECAPCTCIPSSTGHPILPIFDLLKERQSKSAIYYSVVYLDGLQCFGVLKPNEIELYYSVR